MGRLKTRDARKKAAWQFRRIAFIQSHSDEEVEKLYPGKRRTEICVPKKIEYLLTKRSKSTQTGIREASAGDGMELYMECCEEKCDEEMEPVTEDILITDEEDGEADGATNDMTDEKGGCGVREQPVDSDINGYILPIDMTDVVIKEELDVVGEDVNDPMGEHVKDPVDAVEVAPTNVTDVTVKEEICNNREGVETTKIGKDMVSTHKPNLLNASVLNISNVNCSSSVVVRHVEIDVSGNVSTKSDDGAKRNGAKPDILHNPSANIAESDDTLACDLECDKYGRRPKRKLKTRCLACKSYNTVKTYTRSTQTNPTHQIQRLPNEWTVGESSLLQLFTTCVACLGQTKGVATAVGIGRIVVNQTCDRCGYVRRWGNIQ